MLRSKACNWPVKVRSPFSATSVTRFVLVDHPEKCGFTVNAVPLFGSFTSMFMEKSNSER